MLALGWVKSCLDGWVDFLLWGFVVSELRLRHIWGFGLGNFVVAGMGLAHVWFGYDSPMCLPWVGSRVVWVDGLSLCFWGLLGQSCG